MIDRNLPYLFLRGQPLKPANEAEFPTNEATKPPNNTLNLGNVNSSSNENTKSACYDPTLLSHSGNLQGLFHILGKEFPLETKL